MFIFKGINHLNFAMKKLILFFLLPFFIWSCRNQTQQHPKQHISPAVSQMEKPVQKTPDSIPVIPVTHASFAIKLNQKTIYFDPVGGASLYKNIPEPDLIVITHAHPDHTDPETLRGLLRDSLKLVVPKTVKEKLPEDLQKHIQVMNNGDEQTYFDIDFRAIPMYNVRKEAKKYHPKGDGNGYIMSFGGKRIYVSGDTGATPEMRNLKNIDVAFVCMNLPYTMPVETAAKAVLDFKPKKVYPYHYRGAEGLSDVKKFKNLVETNNPNINVILLDWYPNKK